MSDETPLDYSAAGVDLDRSDAVKRRIRAVVESTFTAGARGAFGGFGGMYRIPAEARRPVLVASADGVGTKLRVAIESGIAPGEVVVTDGIDRLREGAKVEVTAPFVPRARGPGAEGGRRGQRGGKPGEGKPGGDAKPADGAAAPVSKTGDAKAPEGGERKSPLPAKVESKPGAAEAKAPPDAPTRGGGFRDMTDEQKAAMRKRMEGMTDEQKTEFRKKMQERRQQSQP